MPKSQFARLFLVKLYLSTQSLKYLFSPINIVPPNSTRNVSNSKSSTLPPHSLALSQTTTWNCGFNNSARLEPPIPQPTISILCA
ncbi:hypothetical protein pb186bvf_008199 [Paramecium bursaria]